MQSFMHPADVRSDMHARIIRIKISFREYGRLLIGMPAFLAVYDKFSPHILIKAVHV